MYNRVENWVRLKYKLCKCRFECKICKCKVYKCKICRCKVNNLMNKKTTISISFIFFGPLVFLASFALLIFSLITVLLFWLLFGFYICLVLLLFSAEGFVLLKLPAVLELLQDCWLFWCILEIVPCLKSYFR